MSGSAASRARAPRHGRRGLRPPAALAGVRRAPPCLVPWRQMFLIWRRKCICRWHGEVEPAFPSAIAAKCGRRDTVRTELPPRSRTERLERRTLAPRRQAPRPSFGLGAACRVQAGRSASVEADASVLPRCHQRPAHSARSAERLQRAHQGAHEHLAGRGSRRAAAVCPLARLTISAVANFPKTLRHLLARVAERPCPCVQGGERLAELAMLPRPTSPNKLLVDALRGELAGYPTAKVVAGRGQEAKLPRFLREHAVAAAMDLDSPSASVRQPAPCC